MLRPLLLTAALLTLAACDAVPSTGEVVQAKVDAARERNDGPPIWAVRDADSNLYILGDLTYGHAQTDWLRGSVSEAIARSGTIYFDYDSSDAAELATGAVVTRRGVYNDGSRLSGDLNNLERLQFDAVMNNVGEDLTRVDIFKPFMAVISLEHMAALQAGLQSGGGARAVAGRAQSLSKNQEFLRPPDAVLAALADVPTSDVLPALREWLSDFDERGAGVAGQAQRWGEGYPKSYFDAVLARRTDTTLAWTQARYADPAADLVQDLSEILQDSGEDLAVINADLLPGEAGVLARLKEAGFTVERYYSFQGENVIDPTEAVILRVED